MYIQEVITDPALKQCPFCNQTGILVSIVTYPNGNDDTGYKVYCECGWAARCIRRWYPNKVKLIEEWNGYIIDADVV